MSQVPSHTGFTDESAYNKGQFRSIGIISAPSEQVNRLSDELKELFIASGFKDEFKWQYVCDAKGRFAGFKCIDYAVRHCFTNRLRVGVLSWDTQDGRHAIRGRDDSANLGRMYYHLFRSVVVRQWPDSKLWKFYPDENMSVDWNTLTECLQLGTPSRTDIQSIFEVDSKEEPLVQLADFFAGMCRYSREKFEKILNWQSQQSYCLDLTEFNEPTEINHSKSDEERCTVINRLNEKCKYNRLGVSLNTHNGLRTMDPCYPINFWWYQPQHEEDKAPVRIRN